MIYVGVTEVADLFHVGLTTVTQWYARREVNGFPEDELNLAVGHVWDLEKVVRWYVAYKPANNHKRTGWVDEDLLAQFGIELEPKNPEEN